MRRTVATALLLSLGACSSAPVFTLKVDPADATVYVNGEMFAKGGSRPLVFDFSKVDRICVQATHRDYEPHFEMFDRERIEQFVARNLDVTITLKARN